MEDTSLFRTILDNIADGVCFVDRKQRITLWNRAAEFMTGYTGSEVLGQPWQDSFLATGAGGQAVNPLLATLEDGQPRTGEVVLRHKAGHTLPVMVQAVPVYSGGSLAGAVEILTFSPEDPEEVPAPSQREEAPSAEGSFTSQPPEPKCSTDPLTGLPDRVSLAAYLRQMLQPQPTQGLCVALANLDNFNAFNDTFGGEVGDMALQSVGDSFLGNTEAGDMLGRWDGDEFLGIYLAKTAADYTAIAEQVRELVSLSGVDFPDTFVGLTASVGLATAQPGDTLESIVDRARQLMLQSKRAGKNRSTIETPSA